MSNITKIGISISLILCLGYGKTIIVDQGGSGDYTTIVAAVSASSSGDTIKVNAGVYIEGISVKSGRTLTFIGAGASTTHIYNSSPAVEFPDHLGGGENLSISGFTLQSSSDDAVKIYGRGDRELELKQCVLISDASEGAGVHVNTGSEVVNVTVYNCVFKDSYYGLWGHGSTYTGNAINCVFDNNTIAVQIGYPNNPAGTANIQNSIFINNTTGIYKSNDSGWLQYGSVLSVYNSMYSNSTNYNNTSAGLGDITSNPAFNDISQGYSISSSSPCIDAGNPSTGYNDPDGTRNDMGVYGGPNTWSAGPSITSLSLSSSSVQLGESITISATATK